MHACAPLSAPHADLKLDRVAPPSWNEGEFEGRLTTDLRMIGADSATTMARMTFGKVAPADLKVRICVGLCEPH